MMISELDLPGGEKCNQDTTISLRDKHAGVALWYYNWSKIDFTREAKTIQITLSIAWKI